MAKLYFKYGAMGSSKSAQALITQFNYEELGMSVWLIKPSADTRDGVARLRSRIGLEAEVDVMAPQTDIYELFRTTQAGKCHVVIVDEAYVDFGGQSCVPLIDKYDNLLVVQTCSKSRSLAGARLGFAMGNAELISDLNRIKFSFNPYNVNRLTCLAGIAAMEDEDYFQTCTQTVARTRDKTAAALKTMGFTLTDSKANFLFAESSRIPGGELYRKLKEKGVLVRHFDKPRLENRLRITVGSEAQMEALLTALKELGA